VKGTSFEEHDFKELLVLQFGLAKFHSRGNRYTYVINRTDIPHPQSRGEFQSPFRDVIPLLLGMFGLEEQTAMMGTLLHQLFL